MQTNNKQQQNYGNNNKLPKIAEAQIAETIYKIDKTQLAVNYNPRPILRNIVMPTNWQRMQGKVFTSIYKYAHSTYTHTHISI